MFIVLYSSSCVTSYRVRPRALFSCPACVYFPLPTPILFPRRCVCVRAVPLGGCCVSQWPEPLPPSPPFSKLPCAVRVSSALPNKSPPLTLPLLSCVESASRPQSPVCCFYSPPLTPCAVDNPSLPCGSPSASPFPFVCCVLFVRAVAAPQMNFRVFSATKRQRQVFLH